MRDKIIVWCVTALAMVSLFALHIYNGSGKAIAFHAEGFPTIGNRNAKVEIVLFEDLRCTGCQYFDQIIYPQLHAEYIETGKVKLVAVPLAFLDDSKMVANAAWAVFVETPDQFFPYVNAIFRHSLMEKLNADALIRIAQEVGGIDTKELKLSIQTHQYYDLLEEHLHWAEAIMKDQFGTPTLYVNGKKISASAYPLIQKQIQKILSS